MAKLREVRRVRTSRQQPVSAPRASTPRHEMAKPPEDSLSEQVYQSLKRDIVTGIHPPGEALSEKDLARRYDSSRTPVREAAVRLQQDNLLRVVPNRGYFVTKISERTSAELKSAA